MEKSSFFNSVNGDRKYKAEDFASYFNSLVTNGVFPNPSTNLQSMSNNNMTVTLKLGKAWINGYVYINDSDLVLTVDGADGVLNRIDRIVLRMDTLGRNITAKVKKGTLASSPTAPNLQRDADAYELGIADIFITKGAVSISQANITDLRSNTNLCGWVNSLIQADTTTLFAQFEDGFSTWFSSIKGLLSGDIAGNLANSLDEHKEDTTNYSVYKSNLDANGIYTTVKHKRKDGTLILNSILSGGTSPKYTTRTETYYKSDGTTVDKTITYTITYDENGMVASEVVQ